MFSNPIESCLGRKYSRRGKIDQLSRDYICPCGKSYLSYPALFTHIKTKHNGRAPGQIIKPAVPEGGRRGRPKARQNYDSESQTQDIAANSLNRLCDFVLGTEAQRPEQSTRFKQIYMRDPFFQLYAHFNNHQKKEPKYLDTEFVYEESCDYVFCEFLVEVQKRLNQPFYVDIIFLFVVMMARQIMASLEDLSMIKRVPIQKIVEYASIFLTHSLPNIRNREKLDDIVLFGDRQMGRLLEYFFNWLTHKRYLSVKIKMNERYFREAGRHYES